MTVEIWKSSDVFNGLPSILADVTTLPPVLATIREPSAQVRHVAAHRAAEADARDIAVSRLFLQPAFGHAQHPGGFANFQERFNHDHKNDPSKKTRNENPRHSAVEFAA